LVPDLYNFNGGETGNNIQDGGGDMYDGGNYLNTNFMNSIFYTDNSILENGEFGANGRYFTSKIPGMFLMAADLDGVTEFSITGNLGADGAGVQEETTLTYTSSLNEAFTGYVSRVYNSGDPSINHLIIVADNDEIEVTIANGTGNEDHQVNNLENTDRIYYILFATNGGNEFVSDDIFQDVFDNFVETMLPSLSDVVGVSVADNSLEPTDTTELSLVIYTEDLEPGVLNFTLPVNSNDPNNQTVNIPVNIDVIETPCIEFDYAQNNECTGEVQFNDLSLVELDTWVWEFGDGETSTEQNPIHTYEESGEYLVRLLAGTGLVFSEYFVTVNVDLINVDVAMEISEAASDGSIIFNGMSSEGQTWFWDFGDDNAALGENVSHTYDQSGTYIVSLTVYDVNGCAGVVSDTIDYVAVGISSLLTNQITIYPNPTQGVLNIEKRSTSATMEVSLYDANGKLIIAPFSLLDETTRIDIRDQPNGVYMVKLVSDDGIYYGKVVKQ